MNEQSLDINAHFVKRSGLVARATIDRSGRVIEANTLFESIFGAGRDVAEITTLPVGLSWGDLLATQAPSRLTLLSRTSSNTFTGWLYPAAAAGLVAFCFQTAVLDALVWPYYFR